jgi:hypothetical protein
MADRSLRMGLWPASMLIDSTPGHLGDPWCQRPSAERVKPAGPGRGASFGRGVPYPRCITCAQGWPNLPQAARRDMPETNSSSGS